jgi:hypothetical protein
MGFMLSYQPFSIVQSSLGRKSCPTYIFQPIQILVSLATGFTVERLLLLHAQSSWVGGTSLWVDNREGTVAVFVQLLSLVAVCLVIPRSSQRLDPLYAGWWITHFSPF